MTVEQKIQAFDELQALRDKKRRKKLPEFTLKESKKLIIGLMAEISKLSKDGEFQELIKEVQKAFKKEDIETKLETTIQVLKSLNEIEEMDKLQRELSVVGETINKITSLKQEKNVDKRDDALVLDDIVNFLLVKHEHSFDTILSLIMQCTIDELQELPNLDVVESLVSFFSIATYQTAFLRALKLA